MRYFTPQQIFQARQIFDRAEAMTRQYFRLSPEAVHPHRYDVKTLAELQKHEVTDSAFAHICRYFIRRKEGPEGTREFPHYRVCLQDHRILDAVDRGRSFIKYESLMLYIAVHELTHVVRFSGGHSDFDAPEAEKDREERKVNTFTQNILSSNTDRGVRLVMDCFNKRYDIDAIGSN
ncbi:MAG TPA: hypothetical protein PLR20_07525 [Syntrophales bacterium]|jgi:hypothetical protein|nr:hypothetical protein [Syntrophales bacterium]HOX93309.1 hypothetical protein [Syntrophales bacterium]HPI56510.1 hypothetical protein [Syntrophales bacterium]HPN25069.1 hypothetical protein [Syntrophales bacterium]HQM29188.1 hypothetical protein [Syntrophales bacterium]